MNERIKELMLEAGYAAPEIALRAQKLAELIINDCASVIEKGDRQLEISNVLCKSSTRTAIDKAAQSGGLKVYTKGIVKSIKNHFGVEE